VDVAPRGGTLVAFLSGTFHHEVLPATRERLSVTGWLKVRS
jgi:SM-20-related protein